MTRYARQYTLLHPTDCLPPHGLDLTPGSRDSQKVEMLETAFRTAGFDKKQPALVGYPDGNGMIQLTSGTHRHTAGMRADIFLPVKIIPRAYVEAYWGKDEWFEKVMPDIPVEDLECAEVKEGTDYPGIDERIDLSSAY